MVLETQSKFSRPMSGPPPAFLEILIYYLLSPLNFFDKIFEDTWLS